MQLIKYAGRFEMRQSIQSLLRELGLPREVWVVKNFWWHYKSDLEWILEEARKLYKVHARHVHPRLSNDEQERAKKLNSLWNEIQRRFRQKLNPTKSVIPRQESFPGKIKRTQAEYRKKYPDKIRQYRNKRTLEEQRAMGKIYRSKPEAKRRRKVYDQRRWANRTKIKDVSCVAKAA